MTALFTLLCFICVLNVSQASVTVYHQVPLGQSTQSAAGATYTGAAAYDPTVLNPPAVPDTPTTQFTLELQSSSQAVQGISIMQSGAFLGFSIETSVINQVLGVNSSFLQVPFLNLMANIKQRAGRVHIRIGGNTQDSATLVDSIPDGKAMEKDKTSLSNPTATPGLLFTAEIIYMLGNISALANVKWYLGIPFNDTTNLRLRIAEVGEAVLGDNLLGLQVGNEPDLYAAHGHRPTTYSPYDYFGEFSTMVQAISNNQNIPVKNNLIGPSVASGDWTPEMVWDTGFIPAYTNSLSALAVEHYPDDNCGAQYGLGSVKDPQTEFPNYLNHTAGQAIVKPYINSSQIAQAAGKPFLMFETNTASCGGFPGISDSFGAALWALDYGLQMASSNFSGALFHVGGQNVYYNPFTPPPTNETSFHQWTIGAIYYSVLIVSEAFGPNNNSQIIDLNANGASIYTPAYAIYEGGSISKVALFNYVTDASGANTYTATISVGGGQTGAASATPAQVKVKYFAASSVSDKYNLTWAGQTFGSTFGSDGRLTGDLDVKTVTCDQTANTCKVQVPAPGFALVFLTDSALSEITPQEPMTFPTTAVTKHHNTVTVDASVLATSNGFSGSNRKWLGSTSQKSSNGAQSSRGFAPDVIALVAVVLGAVAVRSWA